MIFETERLYVRRWKQNDLVALHDMYNDSALRQFILPLLTIEETQFIFETQLDLYNDHFPFGRYFIVDKRSDKFIGLLLLKKDNTKAGVEIGYSIIKNEWQKGYATEIVKAAVSWIFQQDRFVSVSAVTELVNEKSSNVLLKCGFQSQKIFIEYSSTKHLFNLNKDVPVVV